MDRKKFAEALGGIDDTFLDEALGFVHKPNRARIKKIVAAGLVAAISVIFCVIAAAMPSEQEYDVRENMLKFMQEHIKSNAVAAPDGSVTVSAEYLEDGSVFIKVEADKSIAPFDVYSELWATGFGYMDTDTQMEISAKGAVGLSTGEVRGYDEGVGVKETTMSGGILLQPVSERFSEELDALDKKILDYSIQHKDEKGYMNTEEFKALLKAYYEQHSNMEIKTHRSPQNITVLIGALSAFDENGDGINIIGEWSVDITI